MTALSPGNIPEFILFLLISATVLILPGFLIFTIFFNRKKFKIFEIIPLSFGLSITLISTLSIILYLTGSNVTVLVYLITVSTIIFLAINALLWWKKRHIYLQDRGKLYNREASPDNINTSLNMVIYIIMLIAFGLMVYSGAYVTWHSDALDHVGTIRDIVEKRQIFPTNAYYQGEEGLGPDPRKGLFHTTMAIISLTSGLEAYRIWIWLPSLLLPILICSYYAFSRELFRNEKIAAISVILFFLCYEGFNRGLMRTVGYPFRMASIFHFTAMMLFFRYLRNRRTRLLLFSAFLGYGLATVHISVYFRFFLALSAFFIFIVLLKRSSRDTMKAILKLVIITVIFSAVFLFLKYRLSYSIQNPYDKHLRHVLIFTRNLYTANPLYVLEQIGYLGIFAFILTPFLYRYAIKNDRIMFLFSNMIITPLIIFNPLVVPPLGEFITIGLVRRIIRMAPYVAVMAFFTYQAIKELSGEERRKSKVKAVLLLAILAAIMVQYLNYTYFYHRPSHLKKEEKRTASPWRNTLEFLEERIEDPSVILSDPWTSFSIPAFTRHYISAVPVGHASPKDAENVKKVREAVKVLSPYIDMETTLSILNRRNIDYIVLNETFDHPLHEYCWSIVPSLFPRTRRKFEKYPELFERIHRGRETYVYRYIYHHEIPESLAVSKPEKPFVIQDEPEPENRVNANFQDQFRLVGVTIARDTVSYGDSVKINCYWKNTSTRRNNMNFKIATRFDTGYPENLLYSKYWSKIYRKILEKSVGKRFRFRSEHNPVKGIYPPNFWDKEEMVLDRYKVRIPGDISPGTYLVKIKMLHMPYGPVYRFSDFIRDEDVYDGVTVDSLVITPE